VANPQDFEPTGSRTRGRPGVVVEGGKVDVTKVSVTPGPVDNPSTCDNGYGVARCGKL
jgi:hypothetical protein